MPTNREKSSYAEQKTPKKTYVFRFVVEAKLGADGMPDGWHVFCPGFGEKGVVFWESDEKSALAKVRHAADLMTDERLLRGEAVWFKN